MDWQVAITDQADTDLGSVVAFINRKGSTQPFETLPAVAHPDSDNNQPFGYTTVRNAG